VTSGIEDIRTPTTKEQQGKTKENSKKTYGNQQNQNPLVHP